ncbi:MAG: GntR family transcriptional regulator [Alcaligenaceae bacterium]|nr:GntR family transcriptional regulator [Alcaligenaceae bacterium]
MKKINIPGSGAGQFGRKIDVGGTFSNPFRMAHSGVKTLPEQLAEILVEMIINGTFAQGQRLYETSLATQFSVSRGPVREALRLLEGEGLVTMASRRGASVTKLTERRLVDIFSVRSALMGICAEELAKRCDDDMRAVLKEGTRRLFAAHDSGDVGEYIIIVYQLSIYISESADNSLAKEILFSLGRQTLSLTRQVFEYEEYRQIWANDWKGIADGICANDPDRASRAVHALLENIKISTLEIFESQRQCLKKKAAG